MKSILTILLLYSIPAIAFKDKYSEEELKQVANQIQKEGLLLYRSEAASWYGTDIFLSKYQGDRNTIGGYFSYPDGKITKCVFYSKDVIPKIIGTISFDSLFSIESGNADLAVRELSSKEDQYYTIRQDAVKLINEDSTFRRYDNTNFNIVPLIDSKQRVYVMTSTNESGTVLYGNDYVIDFDKGKIKSLNALHSSLIPSNYQSGEKNIKGHIHTHIDGYSLFMTPTDICITKLFENLTGANVCTTVSGQFISIWTGKSLNIYDK